MSKKMKALIAGSLLLNVLLIGLIIGHASHRLGMGRGYGMRRHPQGAVVKLPEEKRDLFYAAMKKVHLENREVLDRIRRAREKALEILTAPEFDETAYQVQVSALHALRGEMMQKLADATMDLAGQLNQEERRALAEVLREPPRFLHGGRPRRAAGPPVP